MARYIDFLNELIDDEDFLELADVVMQPRRRRNFGQREDQFDKFNDKEFKDRFRLSKNVTEFLIDQEKEVITSDTNRNYAVSPTHMVLITLRFLATGSFLRLVGDSLGVDESTASRIVWKVVDALARLGPEFINMPSTQHERNEVSQGFYKIARFPRCVGAIDCTHVKIISPGGANPEEYRNRKGYFSYNVQTVCNSSLKILDILVRWPRSTHDSTIFMNSNLKARFETGEFGNCLLIGDKDYAVKPYLITPLRIVQTPAENLFNESLIRTRNCVERCFGVLKRRFPILALGIRLKIEKVPGIVVACAVLHNIACMMNDIIPDLDEDMEEEIAAIMEDDIVADDERIGNINNITRTTLINQYLL